MIPSRVDVKDTAGGVFQNNRVSSAETELTRETEKPWVRNSESCGKPLGHMGWPSPTGGRILSSAEMILWTRELRAYVRVLESDVLLTKTEGSICRVVWEAEGSTAPEPKDVAGS